MDRRNFLRTTGTVIAGATLAHGALAESPQQGSDSVAGGRLVLPINRNWRYNPKFADGAHDKTFDDAAFQRVVVPHTNVKLPGTVSTIRTTNSFPFTGGDSSCLRKRAGSTCLWTLKA